MILAWCPVSRQENTVVGDIPRLTPLVLHNHARWHTLILLINLILTTAVSTEPGLLPLIVIPCHYDRSSQIKERYHLTYTITGHISTRALLQLQWVNYKCQLYHHHSESNGWYLELQLEHRSTIHWTSYSLHMLSKRRILFQIGNRYFLAAQNSLLVVAQVLGVSLRYREFWTQVIFVYTFSVLKVCVSMCVCARVYMCVCISQTHTKKRTSLFSVLIPIPRPSLPCPPHTPN